MWICWELTCVSMWITCVAVESFWHQRLWVPIDCNFRNWGDIYLITVRYRRARGKKVAKIDLPDFDKMRRDTTKMQPDQMRSILKEQGVAPPRLWDEKPIVITCSGLLFEPFDPDAPPKSMKQKAVSTFHRMRDRPVNAINKVMVLWIILFSPCLLINLSVNSIYRILMRSYLLKTKRFKSIGRHMNCSPNWPIVTIWVNCRKRICCCMWRKNVTRRCFLRRWVLLWIWEPFVNEISISIDRNSKRFTGNGWEIWRSHNSFRQKRYLDWMNRNCSAKSLFEYTVSKS